MAETKLEALIGKLRDIGDALRTTNLIRGREIHQLADDLQRTVQQEFAAAVEAAYRKGTFDGIKTFPTETEPTVGEAQLAQYVHEQIEIHDALTEHYSKERLAAHDAALTAQVLEGIVSKICVFCLNSVVHRTHTELAERVIAASSAANSPEPRTGGGG